MISEPINLTTGPVHLSNKVKRALNASPISHRSNEFRILFEKASELLCSNVSAKHAFVLSGSGTLANEAMLQQIRLLKTSGLILSNGEFGSRLVRQALRINLDFEKYEVEWGKTFDTTEIACKLATKKFKWMLFCHCETSTGILNDLDVLARLCKLNDCLCFTDCVSSVGTVPLDLSNVAMATASSGKGLASYPGLALIFSNIEPLSGNGCPMYLDVSYYAEKNHIPFTVSSNLISALYVSIQEKTTENQMQLVGEYSEKFFEIFNEYGLVPFSRIPSKVLTLLFPQQMSSEFLFEMGKRRVLLSHESDYLRKRSWTQLAVFGCYKKAELNYATTAFDSCLKNLFKLHKKSQSTD